MNIHEFQSNLSNVFTEKFEKQYGDVAFQVCHERDRVKYRATNKAMYSYYIAILNSIADTYYHWKYKIQDDIDYDGTEGRMQMIKDCRNCENIILWAFENIRLK